MLRVGLTGGIGSGKTVVSDCFASLGAAIIDTDIIAHALTQPGQLALDEIANQLGDDLIDNHGILNRDHLRERVFTDPLARKRLEAILHPLIRYHVAKQLDTIEAPYCVIVIPLMVETGFDDLVNRVLVVDAPDRLRIQWLMARNSFSEQQIMTIMESQASRQQRNAIADDLIINDATIAALKEKIKPLHQQYLALSNTQQLD